MHRLWILFCQFFTAASLVGLALFAVVGTPALSQTRGTPPLRLQDAPPASGAGRNWSLGPAARKAIPSVVNITTSTDRQAGRNPLMEDPMFRFFFGDPGMPGARRSTSLGSGVVVDADGHIVTNNHVVEGSDDIQVALQDGRRATAQLVGADPETDVAVLKIDLPKLVPITWGRSENLQIGDFVLAIGNPFGVGQTVTMGIVSALGRGNLGMNVFESFIQTDAPINPGNSGGALIDADGNLIGINSAIYSRSGGSQGIGFAIPVSLVRSVLEQIVRHGAVARGWIGVEPQDLTPEVAASLNLPGNTGALVAAMLRGGPADKAGVRLGDILLAINGTPVTGGASMLSLIAAIPPGRPAELRLRRQERELTIQLKVGRRPRIPQLQQLGVAPAEQRQG